MKKVNPQWYKNWSLDIKKEAWVQDTENQVEFIVKTLKLHGDERILDLACGFGRHALALAKRGYKVVGVDITKDFIDDARNTAAEKGLDVEFVCADIRDVSYQNEFDVVLSISDGAIGYLENDEENLKIFDIVSKALKNGGKHFMDVCNAEYAQTFLPKRHWEESQDKVTLAEFDWDPENHRMIFSGWEIKFGEIAAPSKNSDDCRASRLYTIEEFEEIFKERSMEVLETFSNYYGKAASYKDLQLVVYCIKH